MEAVTIFPWDDVAVDKVDAVSFPELSHGVANVVSFNHKAACFAGVGINLGEVVDGVASHKLLPLIDRMILAYREAELKPFANIFLD